MNDTKLKGILLTVGSAIMFGCMPTFVTYLRSGNMGISTALTIRFGEGALLYFIFLLVFKKLFLLRINKKVILKLILTSFFFCMTSLLLFYSYTRISSGTTTVIHFIYPILVTIISIKNGRDKLSVALVITIVCSFFGIILISDPFKANLDLVGVTTAFLSAVAFALYTYMVNDEELKKIDNTVFVFYTSTISTIISFTFIIVNLLLGTSTMVILGEFSGKVLIGALGVGLFCGIGVIFFAKGVKYIGGPIGGALSAFEPLTAVILGCLLFSETITIKLILGGIFILGSTLLLSYSKIHNQKKAVSIKKLLSTGERT